MRKSAVFVVLCLSLLLSLPVSAAKQRETPEYDFSLGLDGIMDGIMEKYRLNEDNFVLGWEDIESGETWFYQEDKFMVGGSMYKMPLNMVLTDMIDSGELENTENIQLSRYNSIVYSDNEAAQWLRKKISENNVEYRSALARYSGFEATDLPDSYFRDNRFSPRFMINTLRYLYDNSDTYAFVINCMKLAHPGRYFCKYQGDYEIAHKYGFFENALCDSAIVYTERPFVLVCMTQSVSNAEELLGEVCEMFAMYANYLVENPPEPAKAQTVQASQSIQPTPTPRPKAELEVRSTPEPEPEATPVPTAEAEEPAVTENGTEMARRVIIYALSGALVVLAVVAGAVKVKGKK